MYVNVCLFIIKPQNVFILHYVHGDSDEENKGTLLVILTRIKLNLDEQTTNEA